MEGGCSSQLPHFICSCKVLHKSVHMVHSHLILACFCSDTSMVNYTNCYLGQVKRSQCSSLTKRKGIIVYENILKQFIRIFQQKISIHIDNKFLS